jgi:hypothetical protein
MADVVVVAAALLIFVARDVHSYHYEDCYEHCYFSVTRGFA